MRLLTTTFAVLVCLSLAGPARAEPKYQVATGVICDDLPYITRLIELWNDDDPRSSVQAVNRETGSEVCMWGEWVTEKPMIVPTPRTIYRSGIWEVLSLDIVGKILGNVLEFFDPPQKIEKYSARKTITPVKAKSFNL